MGEYSIGDKAMKERFFGIYQTADLVPTFGINPFDSKEWIETSVPTQIKQHAILQANICQNLIFFQLYRLLTVSLGKKGYVRL